MEKIMFQGQTEVQLAANRADLESGHTIPVGFQWAELWVPILITVFPRVVKWPLLITHAPAVLGQFC